jgi:hypothetical protein
LLPIQGLDPAVPIFIKGFHPKKRFTNYGLSWALSKSITYIVTGVFATFVETQFGMFGLLIFLLTASAVFLFSINSFVCEKEMRKIIAHPEKRQKKEVNTNKMQHNVQNWIKE